MSATVLDRAPALVDDAVRDWRQRCDRRLEEMRADRTSWWVTWHDIAWYIMPNRGRFFISPNQGGRGRQKTQKIIDMTATLAVRKLASFLMAGITSPARQWFRLMTGDSALDADDDVKQWCAEVQRRMMRVFAEGNFYNAIGQVYEEISGFGTGPMICLKDYDDVARFYPLTAGEFLLAINDRMMVDTLAREYVLTVAQVVRQFGLANCSSTVQGLWTSNRFGTEIPIVHLIMPNQRRKPGAIGWQGYPIVGCYYEWGNRQPNVLKLEGFVESPFVAPRWHVIANDAYGRGPGEDALPDTKSLQVAQRRFAEAIDKLVRPPMQADASLLNSPLDLTPAGISFVANLGEKSGLRPVYEVPPNITSLAQKIQDFRSGLKETFYNDLILMVSQMDSVQPVTAEEIKERREEKLLMLGPMLERFHNEGLTPVIRIVFGIMERGGLLPPKPAKMGGHGVQPDYISLLAQAQKAVGTTSIEAVFRFMGGLAAVYPDLPDVLDGDYAVRVYNNLLSNDPKMLKPEAMVQALRQQKQQAAAQQQAMQQSMAAVQGASTLSQTQLGNGQSALDMMAGTGGATGQ